MQYDYVVGELHRDNDLAAFALICSVAPTFGENDWAAIFDSTRTWRCISASDLAGRVRGLAVFRLLMHPEVGLLMDVPIFIALSAADHHKIAESLFSSLEAEATACRFIRVWNDLPRSLAELENIELFRRWDHGLIYRVHPKQ
ncbi:hypothetical protein QO004_005351 [Rhizobium mesoamericanum]|uniref:hypothetical protein n=1 Tax=Rhizobium mesoamericanum TaxID=1079800 RepID=UPI00278B0356|nr:hypothetical protein [Rhizobium mesoamericanum]MDQ0563536.1 hypothetical protein [Rhizobium mesoamericanum]